MDELSKYKIVVISEKVNQIYDILISLIVDRDIDEDVIRNHYKSFFRNIYPEKAEMNEIEVDVFLNKLVLQSINFNVVCVTSSIRVEGHYLPTGGILGNPNSKTINSIESGKIYKCDNDLHFFGYSGGYSVVIEGNHSCAFKIREYLNYNINMCNEDLIKIALDLSIKKIILTEDGTGRINTSSVMRVFDFQRETYEDYGFL